MLNTFVYIAHRNIAKMYPNWQQWPQQMAPGMQPNMGQWGVPNMGGYDPQQQIYWQQYYQQMGQGAQAAGMAGQPPLPTAALLSQPPPTMAMPPTPDEQQGGGAPDLPPLPSGDDPGINPAPPVEPPKEENPPLPPEPPPEEPQPQLPPGGPPPPPGGPPPPPGGPPPPLPPQEVCPMSPLS